MVKELGKSKRKKVHDRDDALSTLRDKRESADKEQLRAMEVREELANVWKEVFVASVRLKVERKDAWKRYHKVFLLFDRLLRNVKDN